MENACILIFNQMLQMLHIPTTITARNVQLFGSSCQLFKKSQFFIWKITVKLPFSLNFLSFLVWNFYLQLNKRKQMLECREEDHQVLALKE